MSEKRPRHYAAEIIRLPEAKRAAALRAVPERLRAQVAGYVADWPIRFRASIKASAALLERLPRGERVAKLRAMPRWRRRRVLAESEQLSRLHER